MDTNYYIKKFTDEEEEWDDFVLNESVNGTFLQTRNFLNYHPKGRFHDHSLLIYNHKKHLMAVIPGCEGIDEDEKIFVSHKGSTFGGLIYNQKSNSVQKIIELLEAVEDYLKSLDFAAIKMKPTSDPFMNGDSSLLQYCLYYKDYEVKEELCLKIDYADYKEDIIFNFSQGKRTDVRNCLKAGMELRPIDSFEELKEFYHILCVNLEKYNTLPVHTLDELEDFRSKRLKDNCGFFGVYLDDRMVAGSMMFYFPNCGTSHTQYLCALPLENNLSPMTFLFYQMLLEMKEMGFATISWGGTTEEEGKYLNVGLAKSKEAFGSTYYNNKVYVKKL